MPWHPEPSPACLVPRFMGALLPHILAFESKAKLTRSSVNPARLRGGRAIGSLGTTPNPAEHFFPGGADRSLAVDLLQPPVQLLALGLRQQDRFRRSGETLPRLIQESQPLLEAESGNVDGSHPLSIPHPPRLRRLSTEHRGGTSSMDQSSVVTPRRAGRAARCRVADISYTGSCVPSPAPWRCA